MSGKQTISDVRSVLHPFTVKSPLIIKLSAIQIVLKQFQTELKTTLDKLGVNTKITFLSCYNYMVRLQALLFFVDSFCLDELSDFLLQPCQEKLYMITIRCGMVAAQ